MIDKKIIDELKEIKQFTAMQVQRDTEILNELRGIRREIEIGNIRRS